MEEALPEAAVGRKTRGSDGDMVATFDDKLARKLERAKGDEKPTTVWEAYLDKKREKKKARLRIRLLYVAYYRSWSSEQRILPSSTVGKKGHGRRG